MDQKKIDPDIDALVKRIFALKPESKARATAELERDGRKGSETREEEVTPPRPVSTTGAMFGDVQTELDREASVPLALRA
jgi:hypothetical protein